VAWVLADLSEERLTTFISSPLTRAQPDLYIDVQNAASMLFRLEPTRCATARARSTTTTG
jgi:hypothetical protein